MPVLNVRHYPNFSTRVLLTHTKRRKNSRLLLSLSKLRLEYYESTELQLYRISYLLGASERPFGFFYSFLLFCFFNRREGKPQIDEDAETSRAPHFLRIARQLRINYE